MEFVDEMTSTFATRARRTPFCSDQPCTCTSLQRVPSQTGVTKKCCPPCKSPHKKDRFWQRIRIHSPWGSVRNVGKSFPMPESISRFAIVPKILVNLIDWKIVYLVTGLESCDSTNIRPDLDPKVTVKFQDLVQSHLFLLVFAGQVWKIRVWIVKIRSFMLVFVVLLQSKNHDQRNY